MLALRFPSAKKKVETELGKARLDIEAKLVPQGPGVTRHLSLPNEGHDTAWILAEMAKMDAEAGNHVDWRDGKVSGAVYRACCRYFYQCFVNQPRVHGLQTAGTTCPR